MYDIHLGMSQRRRSERFPIHAIATVCSFNGGRHHDDKCATATKVASAGAIGVLAMNFIFMYLYG